MMDHGLIFLLLAGILMALLLIRSVMGRMIVKCPQCHKSRGMRKLNSSKVDVVIDGRPRRELWTYYYCENCNAYLKHHGNKWSTMDDYDPNTQSQQDVALQKPPKPPAK